MAHGDRLTRPPIDQAVWQGWIDHVCAGVGVDPALVDVRAIHDLTGAVADAYERPMAPVSAHLWGLAIAAGKEAGAVGAITAAAREAGRRP